MQIAIENLFISRYNTDSLFYPLLRYCAQRSAACRSWHHYLMAALIMRLKPNICFTTMCQFGRRRVCAEAGKPLLGAVGHVKLIIPISLLTLFILSLAIIFAFKAPFLNILSISCLLSI
jgi:hypothetical protein